MAFADNAGFLPPHHYDQIFTAHGVIMIFFVAMPLVTGFMNYVVPLMLGVRDVDRPLALLLPGLKLVPTLYVWRVRQRIYSRYGELMAIEREAFGDTTPERRTELIKRHALGATIVPQPLAQS